MIIILSIATKKDLKDFLKSYKIIKVKLDYLQHFANDDLNSIFACEKHLECVKSIIDLLDDDRLKLLLSYRYIHFKTVSEISEIFLYSEDYVRHLFVIAIDTLYENVNNNYILK